MQKADGETPSQPRVAQMAVSASGQTADSVKETLLAKIERARGYKAAVAARLAPSPTSASLDILVHTYSNILLDCIASLML